MSSPTFVFAFRFSLDDRASLFFFVWSLAPFFVFCLVFLSVHHLFTLFYFVFFLVEKNSIFWRHALHIFVIGSSELKSFTVERVEHTKIFVCGF